MEIQGAGEPLCSCLSLMLWQHQTVFSNLCHYFYHDLHANVCQRAGVNESDAREDFPYDVLQVDVEQLK